MNPMARTNQSMKRVRGCLDDSDDFNPSGFRQSSITVSRLLISTRDDTIRNYLSPYIVVTLLDSFQLKITFLLIVLAIFHF